MRRGYCEGSEDSDDEVFWKSLDDIGEKGNCSGLRQDGGATSLLFSYEANSEGLADTILDAINDIENGEVANVDGTLEAIAKAVDFLCNEGGRTICNEDRLPAPPLTHERSDCMLIMPASSAPLIDCNPVPTTCTELGDSMSSVASHSEAHEDILSEASIAFLFGRCLRS